MSFSIGETVGRYRITEQLGQGGMATVYRAYDANLDRYVAIKAMHQAFREDTNFLARFKREAQIVAKLRHPHIVTVHEFDEHHGQPYLVMEFIEGETLKARLTRKPFTMKETVATMTAVGQALTYAHEQGVLHRDIKPSNILLDKAGRPYLTDFGLARMVQAGESTLSQDMLLGTPQYISPEQAQGIRELGPATDIYSLGIVLYQLVVGRVPYSADTPYAIIHDHIYKPLPMPSQVNPNVPPEVERVLLKALAKEPGDRFQSAVEMVSAFQAAVEATQLDEMALRTVKAPVPPVSPPDKPKGFTPAIPAAAPSTPETAALTPTAQLQKRRRTLWMLGGLGAFIFICLLSLFIAIAATANSDLRSDTDIPTGNPQHSATDEAAHDQAAIPQLSVAEAQQLVEDNPDDPAAQFALALALLRDDQRTEAQAALNQGTQLALEANNPALISAAGQEAAEMGYTLEALTLYMHTLPLLADRPALRNEIGYAIYNTASSAERRDVAILRRVTESRPDSAPLQALLARAYLSIHQLDAAEQAITTALELDGALPEAHLILGELYAASGQRDEAEAEWRFAMTASDAPAWVMEQAEALLADSAQ